MVHPSLWASSDVNHLKFWVVFVCFDHLLGLRSTNAHRILIIMIFLTEDNLNNVCSTIEGMIKMFSLILDEHLPFFAMNQSISDLL